MMTRTQLSFDAEMHRRAKRRAAELGISFSEYARWLVARDLGQPGAVSDVSAVFALGRTSGSDIARDKDRLLGEAVSGLRVRRATQVSESPPEPEAP